MTGTNGKTTVAYLLAQVLEPTAAAVRLRRHARVMACRRRSLAHGLTTPDCAHAAPRARGARRAARRDGSVVARARRRTASRASRSTRPCSRISRAIISTSMAISRATARRSAGCSRCRGLQYAVLNADDPFAATIAAGSARPVARCCVRASRSSAGELSGTARALGPERRSSSTFRASSAAARAHVEADRRRSTPRTCSSALGALLAQGMALPAACAALGAAKPAPGRMEVLGGPPNEPWVVVDYAHTPDALQRVLTTLEDAVGRRALVRVRLRRRSRSRQAPDDGRRSPRISRIASC